MTSTIASEMFTIDSEMTTSTWREPLMLVKDERFGCPHYIQRYLVFRLFYQTKCTTGRNLTSQHVQGYIWHCIGIHLIRRFHPWHETGLRNRISYILWPFLGLLSNGHLSYSQKLKSPFMDVGKFSQNILFWLTKITAVAYFTFFCFEGRVVELAASRSYFTTKRVHNRHTNKYNRQIS